MPEKQNLLVEVGQSVGGSLLNLSKILILPIVMPINAVAQAAYTGATTRSWSKVKSRVSTDQGVLMKQMSDGWFNAGNNLLHNVASLLPANAGKTLSDYADKKLNERVEYYKNNPIFYHRQYLNDASTLMKSLNSAI